MILTTAQAAKALGISPATMRKHREHKGLGHEIVPGRTGWTMADLEQLRRAQGRHLPGWTVRFEVEQLDGLPIKGNFTVWADSLALAKAKAKGWFWDAVVKDHPQVWGIPTRFNIITIKLI